MLQLEARSQPDKDYMQSQTGINIKMRGVLVDWLVEVHLRFDLLPETMFLTTLLLDRYLSVRCPTFPCSRSCRAVPSAKLPVKAGQGRAGRGRACARAAGAARSATQSCRHLVLPVCHHLIPHTAACCAASIVTNSISQKAQVSKSKLQLVGVTAMLIASKYEEMWPPEIADFVYMTDKAYSKRQVIEVCASRFGP